MAQFLHYLGDALAFFRGGFMHANATFFFVRTRLLRGGGRT